MLICHQRLVHEMVSTHLVRYFDWLQILIIGQTKHFVILVYNYLKAFQHNTLSVFLSFLIVHKLNNMFHLVYFTFELYSSVCNFVIVGTDENSGNRYTTNNNQFTILSLGKCNFIAESLEFCNSYFSCKTLPWTLISKYN